MTTTTRFATLLVASVFALAPAWAGERAEDERAPGAPPAPRAPRDARTPEALPPPSRVPGAAPVAGLSFPSPEGAADAFVRALEQNDDEALRTLLGPASDDLAQRGDDASVRRRRQDLAAAARESRRFETGPGGRTIVLVGRMEHPLAVPLVRGEDGWRFDGEAGREELLARRIGENELEAIGLCLAYVAAQREYAAVDRDGDGAREHARRILSTEGNRDGLYWEAAPGEEPSPAGDDLAAFIEDAGDVETARTAPFNGYFWRVLDAQGPHAPGGAHSYVVGDDMVRGAALLAVPAVHGNTGVQSFLVSHHGRVLQKDLGPDGLAASKAIRAFDPDPTWRPVDAATLRIADATAPEDGPFSGEAGAPPFHPAGSAGPAGVAPPCRR